MQTYLCKKPKSPQKMLDRSASSTFCSWGSGANSVTSELKSLSKRSTLRAGNSHLILTSFSANYFVNFAEEAGYSASMSSNLLAIAQGLYAFNRFLAGGLMTFNSIKPRYIMAIYLFLCFVFGLAATLSRGKASMAMLILVLCAESACFATIFTLALRGLGRHTKRGGSVMVAAISGGATIPPMTVS